MSDEKKQIPTPKQDIPKPPPLPPQTGDIIIKGNVPKMENPPPPPTKNEG